MSILHDESIRQSIQKDGLVSHPHDERIKYCSYLFVAGKIFPAGTQQEPGVIDWTDPKPNSYYIIQPGSVTLIQTLECVKMPKDFCGFWWQTNELSRRGLMLINQSIVDPGYEGPLSCTFVNFGNESVRIDPSTPLAKLVFSKLDEPVINGHPGISPHEYQKRIHDTAVRTPESFLQITEFAKRLDDQRTGLVEELNKEKQEIIRVIKKEAKIAKTTELDQLKGDIAGYLKKSIGWVSLAMLMFILITGFIDWMKARAQYSDLIEREITKRIADGKLSEINISVANKEIQNRMNKLEERLRDIDETAKSAKELKELPEKHEKLRERLELLERATQKH